MFRQKHNRAPNPAPLSPLSPLSSLCCNSLVLWRLCGCINWAVAYFITPCATLPSCGYREAAAWWFLAASQYRFCFKRGNTHTWLRKTASVKSFFFTSEPKWFHFMVRRWLKSRGKFVQLVVGRMISCWLTCCPSVHNHGGNWSTKINSSQLLWSIFGSPRSVLSSKLRSQQVWLWVRCMLGKVWAKECVCVWVTGVWRRLRGYVGREPHHRDTTSLQDVSSEDKRVTRAREQIYLLRVQLWTPSAVWYRPALFLRGDYSFNIKVHRLQSGAPSVGNSDGCKLLDRLVLVLSYF